MVLIQFLCSMRNLEKVVFYHSVGLVCMISVFYYKLGPTSLTIFQFFQLISSWRKTFYHTCISLLCRLFTMEFSTRHNITVITVQCCYNVVNLLNILTKDLPVRARYGMSFASTNSLCSACAAVAVYEKSCYIGPRYNGTWLYVIYETFCSDRFVRIWMRAKGNFHQIWIRIKKTVNEIGPCSTFIKL